MTLGNLDATVLLPSRTLQGALADTLRDAIVRGQLRPGQKLDQSELAAYFGVSRIPVREALITLAAEGLVEFSPHRGAAVAELDADELEEIFFVRATLEGIAGRLATARVTPELLERLAGLLEELETAGEQDHDAWVTLNDLFHITIYEVALRPRLLAIIHNLRNTCAPYIRSYITSTVNFTRANGEHRRIYEYLAAGDAAGAEQALREHVTISGQILSDQIRRAEEPLDGADP